MFTNGVPACNYANELSRTSQGMWHQNAVVFENAGFGRARTQSSPAVVNGTLVGGSCPHHQNPVVCIGALVSLASVCNVYLFDGLHVPDSTRPGSLIGLAFDDYGGANLQVSGAFHFPLGAWRAGTTRDYWDGHRTQKIPAAVATGITAVEKGLEPLILLAR